jgi:hypothetical protein
MVKALDSSGGLGPAVGAPGALLHPLPTAPQLKRSTTVDISLMTSMQLDAGGGLVAGHSQGASCSVQTYP